MAALALEHGTTNGRDGKGSIYVWAAGNGRPFTDNCIYDGWANSRFFITTTDLKGYRGSSTSDCTSNFGGTSSGKQYFPENFALFFSFLQSKIFINILKSCSIGCWHCSSCARGEPSAYMARCARSFDCWSVKNHLNDADWVKNGVGRWVNHKYGFGLIDAYNSVVLAQNWTNLPAVTMATSVVTNNSPIVDGLTLEIVIPYALNITIEHVELHFIAFHTRRGDLYIELISPISILAEHHNDYNADFDWKFLRYWGESSIGNWKLKVRDDINSNQGHMVQVNLSIYGHQVNILD